MNAAEQLVTDYSNAVAEEVAARHGETLATMSASTYEEALRAAKAARRHAERALRG